MQIDDLLKDKNLRVTKPRKLILEEISDSKEPISAEEIYDKIKEKDAGLNLSTVYRNLNTLVDKNVLIKNTNFDGISFFQLNIHEHKHFITCISCGKRVIIENCPIDEFARDISNETGFKMKGHSLEFTGLCPDCQKENSK